jgi:DnaJ-class molecular chaperone
MVQPGSYGSEVPCPECGGTGKDTCHACSGSGTVKLDD